MPNLVLLSFDQHLLININSFIIAVVVLRDSEIHRDRSSCPNFLHHHFLISQSIPTPNESKVSDKVFPLANIRAGVRMMLLFIAFFFNESELPAEKAIVNLETAVTSD